MGPVDEVHRISDGQANVLQFRHGIPGFPNARRFVLIDFDDSGGSALQVLHSLDDPDLEMVVAVPWPFFPDYAPELGEADRQELGIEDPQDAVVFCAVTADAERDEVFLNLLGPFVVNATTLEARQVVLADTSQPVRAPVPLAG